MVAFSKLALAASFVAGSFASPVALPTPDLGPLTIFQDLAQVPSKWMSQGAASKDSMVKAQIGLKQSNIQALQDKLMDISHPDSANYGKWLSKKELDAMVAPPAANVAAVKSWLALHGITDVSQPSPDWIEFSVPVSTMETLLNAKYESFYHATEGRNVLRTKQYSIPRLLHSMVDMVTPTTAFYESQTPGIGSEVESDEINKRAACDTNNITPDCIKSLYNIDYTPTGKSMVASTQFIQIAASHSDYKTFGSKYVSGLQDFTDVSVKGGFNKGSGNTNTLLEGNLDTQYTGGLASPNPNQFLACDPQTEGNFGDEISNFASYLTSNANPPDAVSTSYGGEEQYFGNSYLTRVCNEFMKAGSMGISVFFSSGDFGVGGINETSCDKQFYVQWPATCPWITSVGGTQFNGSSEVVAQFPEDHARGSSGGGFSAYFTAPDYQSADTASYVSYLGNKYAGKFNPKNRGFPDISLVSKQFLTVINGGLYYVYGTSASAPSWAAITSILNDYRVSSGKPKLGFLNPLLYSTNGRTALRDVTQGSNQGCNSDGYSATTGWDPATGLGSVDFAKLRAML